MKTEIISYYENACQTPRRAVVCRHRSTETAEEYVRRHNGAIASDGYSHGYGACELREPVDVAIGDDVSDLDMWSEWDGVEWLRIYEEDEEEYWRNRGRLNR
jgi:hypothetical protein